MTRTSSLPQSERSFQSAVIELATVQGWRCFHAHDSRRQVAPGQFVGDRDAAGWPDLVLCRPPRLVVAELKAERGIVSRNQRAWLDALAGCDGIEVHVWYPADWRMIERVLAR